MPHAIRAIVYVPAVVDALRWLTVCARHCDARRYVTVAVATAWVDVQAVLDSGEAQVVVAARRDHLPPDRTPRLEIVTEDGLDDGPASSASRRPHRRRRQAERR